MALDTQPYYEITHSEDERVIEIQQALSEKLDALIEFDRAKPMAVNEWISALRGTLVDSVIAAVHEYASILGVDELDTHTRLDIARHFDAHLRQEHNPLDQLTTVYDPLTNPPERMPLISESQKAEFNSYQTLSQQYATSAQLGYEELADL